MSQPEFPPINPYQAPAPAPVSMAIDPRAAERSRSCWSNEDRCSRATELSALSSTSTLGARHKALARATSCASPELSSASAMAWVLFAVILVFSILQFRILRGHTEL